MAAAVRFAVMLALLALLPAPAFALTVTITNPPEGATLTGTLNVDISASSPSGFDVTLDGALWATNLCCRSTLSVEWRTGLGDNGPHTFRVTARDAGGASATTTRTVSVNNPNVVRLGLVSARDHIEISMTRPQTVYADADRIYLGGTKADQLTGRVYVLARDRASDFPVVEMLEFPHPVAAVRGDDTYLYVLEGTSVHVYRKTRPLSLATSLTPTVPGGGWPGGVAVVGDRLYVGLGQVKANADARHVYMTPLITGNDVVVEIFRDTWTQGRVYGGTAASGTLSVFDRLTGDRLAGIPSPVDGCGQPGFPSDLYVDNGVLAVSWGRCGFGMWLYDPVTLAPIENIAGAGAGGTNAAVRRNQTIVSGDEAGAARAWDFTSDPAVLTGELALRVITDHQGSEDIEIRSLWTDATDGLIFVGSSWGNQTSRAPTLPAFFVIEAIEQTGPLPTVTIAAATSVIPETAGTTDAFVISRTGSTAAALTVNYSVGGTATSGADYDALSGSTTIPAGAASTIVRLSPKTDNVTEGDETVVVTLTSAAGYSVGTPGSATVTIHEAGAPPSASITSPAEGATVSGTVTVGMGEVGLTGTITWTLRLDGGATPIFSTSNTGPTASFSWNTAGLTPGAHRLDLTVQDGGGRTVTVTRNVVVGSGTIGVAITQPGSDGATVSGTSWFVLWVTGAGAGTKTYTLTANGVTLGSTTDSSSGPISIPADTKKVSDGSTPVVATVRDPAGNSGSGTRVVNIQNGQSAFTVLISSPSEGATVSGTVPVNMSESNGTGTITWTLRMDGGATPIFTTSNAGPSATFNWNTSGLTPGTHSMSLSAQDGGGRTAAVLTRNVTVAASGPGAFFTGPADGATVVGNVTVGMGRNTTTGTVRWSLNIDGAQAFTVTNTATAATFGWDTGPVAPGSHTLSLTVQDTATGATSTATRNVTVAGPLSASITTPAEGATVSGIATVGMSASNGVGAISWTLRLDAGSTPIFSTSNTGPTASFGWNTSGLTTGAHTLTLTVQDGGGRTATATRNVTVQSAGTIKVFITQPGTDGTTVAAGSTVWFTIWLENASGSRTLTLSMDGVAVASTTTNANGPISMPWSSSGAAGGTHTATVSVRDAVNNTGSANRTLIVPGPANLTAVINTPLEGATVSGLVTVGMSETNGTGTISWSLQLDGVTPPIFSTSTPASTTTTSFNWDTSGVAPGAHTLTLTVQDGGGRTATATRHVTVTIPPPPGITVNAPSEGATVGGVVSVSVSATNVSGTLTWTVSVDDPQRGGSVPLFSGSGTARTIAFNWDTAATIADGPHTLTATVQDGVGQTATATRHVTVQQQAPPTIRVFITQPGSDGTTIRGTTWFTIWIENAAAGNKTYTMSVDGAVVGTTNTTSNGPVSMAWTTTGTPNGSHAVTITVRDSAGGTGQAVRVVTVAN